MTEIWKDIPDFPGYEVSNMGRVKSIDRKVWSPANKSFSLIKGQIRILDLTGKKYAQIGLGIDGRQYKRLVHRLVAITFIDNPDNLPEVNHKDCNKLNNSVDNLEWVDRFGNARHAKENGKYSGFPKGESKSNAILTKEAVFHIREKKLRNIDYCKMYGIKPSTVSCLQNPTKYPGRWL